MPKSDISDKKKIKLNKSLNPVREKLAVLTAEANARANALIASGTESRALYEAQRTLLPSHAEKYGELFTANLPRSRDINRELARVQAFLTDYTSMIGGAKDFSDGLTHELFGGQFRADGGYGANPQYVTKQQADLVFEIYHKALEAKGGWERVIGYLRAYNTGLVDYGSEQIINAIYDMTEGIKEENIAEEYGLQSVTPDDYRDALINKAEDLIQSMMDQYEAISELQRKSEEYGILEPDADRERRIRNWRFKMEREGYKNDLGGL